MHFCLLSFINFNYFLGISIAALCYHQLKGFNDIRANYEAISREILRNGLNLYNAAKIKHPENVDNQSQIEIAFIYDSRNDARENVIKTSATTRLMLQTALTEEKYLENKLLEGYF